MIRLVVWSHSICSGFFQRTELWVVTFHSPLIKSSLSTVSRRHKSNCIHLNYASTCSSTCSHNVWFPLVSLKRLHDYVYDVCSVMLPLWPLSQINNTTIIWYGSSLNVILPLSIIVDDNGKNNETKHTFGEGGLIDYVALDLGKYIVPRAT